MLPQLVKLMGAESYGLVGFFSLLQSWLLMLDLGMSPTLSREVSRYRGGALDPNSLLSLFSTLKKIFISVSIACCVIIICLSGYISENWLKAESLSQKQVISSIMLMGFAVACRLAMGIYRSAVTGFENMVWLSAFNVIFATLRFVVVFPVLILFGASPIVYFVYQSGVAFVELVCIIIHVNKLMPAKDPDIQSDLKHVRQLLKFSLSIAFTGAVWIIVTQTDKLILSKLLKLSDFGYYTLAVQVAAGITLLSNPIIAAILPRLTKMEAENDHEGLVALYRKATQLVVVFAGSVSLVLVFFADQALFVWTGDQQLVDQVAPYLVLYAIGNFLLAVAAFPYYLQYAKGNLKYHLIGNIGFVIFLLPTLIYLVYTFGGIGAGYAWIGVNGLFLFCWIPVVHHYFVKGLNAKWFLNDIFLTLMPTLIVCIFIKMSGITFESRIYTFAFLMIVGVVLLSIMSCSSSLLRNMILLRLNKYIKKRS